MAAPYLTRAEAASRLTDPETGYGFTAEEAGVISGGDLRAASDELDAMGPFVDSPSDPTQERQWPRNAPGSSGPGMPDAVLDWVALRAYQLSSDDEPPVRSEGAGGVSVSYAVPKLSQSGKRMERLLAPYLLWTGVPS